MGGISAPGLPHGPGGAYAVAHAAAVASPWPEPPRTCAALPRPSTSSSGPIATWSQRPTGASSSAAT